jgi:hypothetical protein
MTEKYPDVCEMVASMLERALPPADARAEFSSAPGLTRPNDETLALWSTQSVTSFVMDAEVVAVDKDTGAYRTFQELSNRAKKDVKLEDVKVVVGVFAFDLMLLNDTVGLSLQGAARDSHRLHSHSCLNHFLSAGTCSAHSFRRLRIPRTRQSRDFLTSSLSIQQSPKTSKHSSSRSWRKSVKG